jgi:hypothetical protein
MACFADMADSPGQQAESESTGQVSLSMMMKDWVNVSVAVGGIAGLISLIFSLNYLHSPWVKVCAAGGLAALLMAVTFSVRLKRSKLLKPLAVSVIASFGIACVFTTAGLFLFAHRYPRQVATNRATTGAATVKFVQRSSATDPISVSCRQQVAVSGHLAEGEVFAVGNIVTGKNIGNTLPVFVPENAAQVTYDNGTWRVPVVFGGSGDAGSEFSVYLEVMPKAELNYLVTEAQQTRMAEVGQIAPALPGETQKAAVSLGLEQSWWEGPSQIPPPGFTADTQVYRRAPSDHSC